MTETNTYYKVVEEDGIENLVAEPATTYNNSLYTYADYLLFKIEERIELIKGRILKMSSPNLNHQSISAEIFGSIYIHLKNKPCKVFAAPFDVRLPVKNKKKDNEIFTVVQPDIMVVCDETKLDSKGICGAPDLIVEIVSPSNSKRDVKIKYDLYEETGVKEYWIVFVDTKTILQFHLVNNNYVASKPQAEEGIIKSFTIENLEIDLEEIFKNVRIND